MSNTDIYRKKKYKNGFVLILNPNYDGSDEGKEFITRKPNPSERRQIIVNYIADTTRKNISIPYLAKKLCVSDRTIQFDLKKLKELKLIEIMPQYDEETHAQIESKYKYIGPKRTAAFKRLTLSALYNPNVDIGIRDFDWDVFYNEDFDEDDYYTATYNAVNLMNAKKRAFKDDKRVINEELIFEAKITIYSTDKTKIYEEKIFNDYIILDNLKIKTKRYMNIPITFISKAPSSNRRKKPDIFVKVDNDAPIKIERRKETEISTEAIKEIGYLIEFVSIKLKLHIVEKRNHSCVEKIEI